MSTLRVPVQHPVRGSIECEGTHYGVSNGLIVVTDPNHIAVLKVRGFTDAHAPATPPVAPPPERESFRAAAANGRAILTNAQRDKRGPR